MLSQTDNATFPESFFSGIVDQIDEKFVNKFNESPIPSLQHLIQINCRFVEPFYFGQFLRLVNGFNPYSITEALSANQLKMGVSFFHFFTAVNTEYTSLQAAIAMSFSKIALPNDEKALNIIFNSFIDSYRFFNPEIGYSSRDMFIIIVSSIICSIKNLGTSHYLNEELLKAIRGSSYGAKRMANIINQLDSHKFTVHFSFGQFEKFPALNKQGIIRKQKGFFSLKKSYFVKLEREWLSLYEEDSRISPVEQIQLAHTKTVDISSKKNGLCFQLSRIDEKDLIYYVPKKTPENSITFHAENESDVQEWVASLNLSSFCETLIALLKN